MKEKARYIASLTVCAVGAVALTYILFRYLFPVTLPFFIAWGMAFAVRPLACRLSRRTGWGVRALRVSLSLAVSLGVIALASVCVWRLAVEAWELLSGLYASGTLSAAVEALMAPFERIFGDGEIGAKLSDALSAALSAAVSRLAGFISGAALAIPRVFVFALVTVISCVYFSLDLDVINSFVKSKLPPAALSRLLRFKSGFFRTGVKYFRAYLVLMGITFGFMLIGLSILRVGYALLIALMIAALDALPVLGVGTFLVPWGVWSLICGDTARGVGLLVLFAVHEVVRQLIEPRIVGSHIGLHPVVTLVLVYVSYSLLGVAGIFLVPLLTVAIKSVAGEENPSDVEERVVGEEQRGEPPGEKK